MRRTCWSCVFLWQIQYMHGIGARSLHLPRKNETMLACLSFKMYLYWLLQAEKMSGLCWYSSRKAVLQSRHSGVRRDLWIHLWLCRSCWDRMRCRSYVSKCPVVKPAGHCFYAQGWCQAASFSYLDLRFLWYMLGYTARLWYFAVVAAHWATTELRRLGRRNQFLSICDSESSPQTSCQGFG